MLCMDVSVKIESKLTMVNILMNDSHGNHNLEANSISYGIVKNTSSICDVQKCNESNIL